MITTLITFQFTDNYPESTHSMSNATHERLVAYVNDDAHAMCYGVKWRWWFKIACSLTRVPLVYTTEQHQRPHHTHTHTHSQPLSTQPKHRRIQANVYSFWISNIIQFSCNTTRWMRNALNILSFSRSATESVVHDFYPLCVPTVRTHVLRSMYEWEQFFPALCWLCCSTHWDAYENKQRAWTKQRIGEWKRNLYDVRSPSEYEIPAVYYTLRCSVYVPYMHWQRHRLNGWYNAFGQYPKAFSIRHR